MDNKTIYEKFDWSKLDFAALKGKIEKVVEFIPEGVSTIADIGCGNGVITNILGQQFEVTAVDRSAAALEFVETKKVQASAENIPLPDGSFDMVFSSEMLEHLEDEVLKGTISEMKRLSKKYIFITVPNDENPNKLSIQCPECNFIYNRPNHLRSFKLDSFKTLFPEYNIIRSLAFGNRTRYYSPTLLKLKKSISPASSWIPNYWISKNDRKTICPYCEHEFNYTYRFHPLASAVDMINLVVSPKKPYWLFVLMERQ